MIGTSVIKELIQRFWSDVYEERKEYNKNADRQEGFKNSFKRK